MMLRSQWLPFTHLVLMGLSQVIITGCKTTEGFGSGQIVANVATSATPALVAGSTANTTASIDAGAYIKIESSWETDDDSVKEPVGTCTVPTGSASGTTQTCTYTVPEAQMYYSRFHFTTGSSDTNHCKEVIFRPYYYQGSVSSTFIQPWLSAATTSTTDCSGATLPLPAACFNGPATELISDFPSNTGLIVLTHTAVELVSTVTSTHNKGMNSNRYMSNTKTDWTSNYASEYIGSASARPAAYGSLATHQDYVMECRDEYYELIYQVTVILNDSNSTHDDFATWP